MGRVIYSARLQALTKFLVRQVLGRTWGRGGAAADLGRLADLIGVEPDKIRANKKARLKLAVAELRQALSATRGTGQPDLSPEALSQWNYHQTYFTDLLTKLVTGWPKARIDELMPWNWTPTPT
jgi:hypothetical protein